MTIIKVIKKMSTHIVRTYIDQYGPIVITHQSGKTLTVVTDLQYHTDYRIYESRPDCHINVSEHEHGFYVHKGEYDHLGFYSFTKDVFDKLNEIKLNYEFEGELRKLLPATKAQVEYYEKLVMKAGRSSHTVEKVNVRVFGLMDYTFKQTQRGNVFVCPIETTGLTTDGHRIQGYMFAGYDNTIKFDSIQAWRMRELTREELMKFDPQWGELVSP